jgi:hypothetical protein
MNTSDVIESLPDKGVLAEVLDILEREEHEFDCPRIWDDFDCTCGRDALISRVEQMYDRLTDSADAYVGKPQPLGDVLQRVNDIYEAAGSASAAEPWKVAFKRWQDSRPISPDGWDGLCSVCGEPTRTYCLHACRVAK